MSVISFNVFNATDLHGVEAEFTELKLIILGCNLVQVRYVNPNLSSNVLSESLSWINLVDVGTSKVSNLNICLPIEMQILLFELYDFFFTCIYNRCIAFEIR